MVWTLKPCNVCVAQVQRGKRAVNRKGFGYGGEDAYYYAWGPRCVPITDELPI